MSCCMRWLLTLWHQRNGASPIKFERIERGDDHFVCDPTLSNMGRQWPTTQGETQIHVHPLHMACRRDGMDHRSGNVSRSVDHTYIYIYTAVHTCTTCSVY